MAYRQFLRQLPTTATKSSQENRQSKNLPNPLPHITVLEGNNALSSTQRHVLRHAKAWTQELQKHRALRSAGRGIISGRDRVHFKSCQVREGNLQFN